MRSDGKFRRAISFQSSFSNHTCICENFRQELQKSTFLIISFENSVTLQMDGPLNHMGWNNFHLKKKHVVNCIPLSENNTMNM